MRVPFAVAPARILVPSPMFVATLRHKSLGHPEGRFLGGHAVKLVSTLLAVFVLGACTTTTVTPELVQKPPKHFAEADIGEIKIDGELWQHLLPHFRVGLMHKLEEEKAFERVRYPAPSPPSESAVLVVGHITEIDEGSAAARFLIGFGAGRAKARGEFEVQDASSGTSLAKFQTWEAYSGGAGIGGFDMVSMEDLLKRLGEATGSTIARWSRGEPLEPPASDQ